MRLALRSLSRRRVLTVFMFLSLMIMTTGFLLIVSVSERIALEVWSFEGSMLLGTGHVAGCPYWCDVVMVPRNGEYFIPDSVVSEVVGVEGVEWAEPLISITPNKDRFSGDWRIRKPDGTVLTPPTPVIDLIEGVDPQLELSRLQLESISGRFLEEGERGAVVVGEPLASVFEIGVNDTIVIPHTMKSIYGFFSIEGDVELRVVGIYRTETDYDRKMLTTIEEAQDLYGLPGQLTCILVKFLPYANATRMYYELNKIPNAEVFVPIEKLTLVVFVIQPRWSAPTRVTSLSPTRVVEVAYGQVFFITIFVTGAFIASSTSSKLYERRHEIGLLKSVGFRPSFIQLEVVIETLMIGFAAGVTGFVAANSIALLSQRLTIGWLPSFPLKMGTNWFVLVLVLSCGVSVVSSYIPAVRSSRIPPMEAMRRI